MTTSPTAFLDRPEGRIAYDVTGHGPLVVCVPGMGDLRSTYRDLVPLLADAGYRVVTTDLRGHGDSGTSFRRHGDVATAEDALALVADLGGPAVLVGSSMGAGAGVWVAAQRPDLVAGLVLLGPFVRDAEQPRWRAALVRTLLRLALLRPWGPAAWESAYRRFALGRDAGKSAVGAEQPGRGGAKPPGGAGERSGSAGKRSGSARPSGVTGRVPPWFDAHVAAIRASLRDPAHLRSLRTLVGTLTHAPVQARLAEVRAPALVVIGAQDPDFPDPAAEVADIEALLGGDRRPATGMLVDECGHYPHYQRLDVVGPRILDHLAGLRGPDGGWSPSGSDGDLDDGHGAAGA